MKRLASALLVIFSLWVSISVSHAQAADRTPELKNHLILSLQHMDSVYRHQYAPASWKRSQKQWDIDLELRTAMQAILLPETLTTEQGRKAVRAYVNSMRDYHVSLGFRSTERSTLPFVVQGAGEKYFLAYIDRAKLPSSTFTFEAGDELVTFGGRPTASVVAELQALTTENVPETDRAWATMVLTNRRAARGYPVQKGPITLGIKKQGSQTVSRVQLIWEYTHEKIADRYATAQRTLVSARPQTGRFDWLNRQMVAPEFLAEAAENPYGLGARKTFTPDLGVKIWESDASEPFHAYIFKGDDRRLIGYLRLPSYVPEDINKAVDSFRKIIAMFEVATDSLVIDQVNNPGGSVFYLYTLASILAVEPLFAPQHEMVVTPAEVQEMVEMLPALEAVKSDEDARKLLGPRFSGYPVSFQLVQFLKNYAQFLISEWEAGKTLTSPFWIAGVDMINPDPVHYTKPILVLVNQLDFSGGDFFPAILQDNKRAAIMGTRTAGAGGYVNQYQFPNRVGVEFFSVTESLAHRINSNPIENLGITPDIPYAISEADLTQGYRPYVHAIRQAIKALTP